MDWRTDADIVPVKAPTAYTVEVGGEAVILEEVSQRLHLLNPTASLLWACFDGLSSVADIAADLAEVLDARVEDVISDSVALVRLLEADGLLVPAKPSVPSVPPVINSAGVGSGPVLARLADGSTASLSVLAEPPNP